MVALHLAELCTLRLMGVRTIAYKRPSSSTGRIALHTSPRAHFYPPPTMSQITPPNHYTRIVLAERPETNITPTTFRKETVPFDLEPGPGEVLLRVDWLSLDPTMRTWLSDARSYQPPVQIGTVMRSLGLGTVIEAGEGCELRPGDIVNTQTGESYSTLLLFLCWLILWIGWTEYVVTKEAEIIQKIQ